MPCSWGESAGQILTYVYVSEYLCREGVRLNATSAPEGLFAVSITGTAGDGACFMSALIYGLHYMGRHGKAHMSQHSHSSSA